MLSSLPLITPQDAQTLSHTFPSHTPSLQAPSSDPSSSRAQHPQRVPAHQSLTSSRGNPLTQLRADENFIQQRKLNIQRFGATWIRPPGISKTYQASMDEAAEREEAERMAEREAMMMDMGEEGEGAEMTEGDEDGVEVERDLDDDVPDAEDAEVGDFEDEDDELDEEIEATELGLMAAGADDEEGVGAVEADAEEQMLADRDLDDDVPEAGSYQHTDSEADDFSDDEDEHEDLTGGGLRDVGMATTGNDVMRPRPQGLSSASSSLVSGASSFLGSSPAADPRGGRGAPRRS